MKMIRFYLVICGSILLCFSKTSLAETVNSINDANGRYIGDIKYFYDTYKECSSTHLTTCLKEKVLLIMDRISRSSSEIKIIDGVTFVPDQSSKMSESSIKTKEELEKVLPRALNEKERALNNMIFDKIFSFFKHHTLQVKFPSIDDMERSIEARGGGNAGFGGNKGGFGGNKGGKDKKNGHWIMIPLLLGSTLVPLAFGALALLAGKALIVSKLALALASIIGIKKLISGSGHHHEAAHEVVVSGGHGSGWGRIGNYNGQNLAYNGYTP